MRSVSVRLADLDRVKINLGIAGENEHTHVLFDCKKAFDQYPNATPFLIVTPPRGDIYPAVVTRDGDIVEWVVTDSDLIYHGNGKVQLQFKQGDIIMKSYEAMTSIAKSSEPTGTVPTPIQNWITQANAILASIPDDINAALAAAKASGEFDGADGVGISAITLKSSVGLVDTYTITLTDGRDYDFTVTNGTPGQNGVGIQSIAKTSTVGLVDTYTVTLTNGQTYPFTVTNGQNGVEIDDTTPANNKVFSSAKVDQELTDVKTAIQGVNDTLEDIDDDLYSYEYLPVPMDEITATADLGLEAGYISIYGDTGGTGTYHHTKKIAVGAGDVLEYKYNSGVQLDIRFVTAYNGETIVPSKGQSDQATSYTVPEGVTHIILSLANSQIDNIANLHRYYTAQGQKTKVFDVGAYVKRISKVGNIITAEEDSLTANTDLVLESNLDGKKEGRIDFWAKFSSFDSVTVGHGKGTYGGYIVIDDTNAVVYYNGTAYKTYTHGLTIADFIEVHIEQTDMAQAKFSITSSGGQWKSSENALWHGSKGDIFAKATTALSDIRFSASFPDMRKDVFVFGDSYITMGDDTRWPYYIKQTYNATNLALFGWGGEGSTDALTCFNKVLTMVKPKIVAWFIGMNDGDSSSAINSDWQTTVETVISTCRTNGIRLVLATIPNTPTVRNTYKNTYVKESGFDYVDFAKAVNAESAGAEWYTGMLSNDNVHPSALGGKALACRLIADLPEIQ